MILGIAYVTFVITTYCNIKCIPTFLVNSSLQARTSSHINRLSKRFALIIACELLDLEINIAFMGVRAV